MHLYWLQAWDKSISHSSRPPCSWHFGQAAAPYWTSDLSTYHNTLQPWSCCCALWIHRVPGWIDHGPWLAVHSTWQSSLVRARRQSCWRLSWGCPGLEWYFDAFHRWQRLRSLRTALRLSAMGSILFYSCATWVVQVQNLSSRSQGSRCRWSLAANSKYCFGFRVCTLSSQSLLKCWGQLGVCCWFLLCLRSFELCLSTCLYWHPLELMSESGVHWIGSTCHPR